MMDMIGIGSLRLHRIIGTRISRIGIGRMLRLRGSSKGMLWMTCADPGKILRVFGIGRAAYIW